jgi:hypothetical protein
LSCDIIVMRKYTDETGGFNTKICMMVQYIAKYGDPGAARTHAGINLMDYEELKKDKLFRQILLEADQRFKGSLIAEAAIRGRDGYDEILTYQGQIQYQMDENGELLRNPETGELIPVTIKKKSDRLLATLIDKVVVKETVFEKDLNQYDILENNKPPENFQITFVKPPKQED